MARDAPILPQGKSVILVLGGHGQLGTELVMRAGEAGVPLTAVGHSEVDVADPKTIARAIARYRPTLIVNAAAYNNVDRAESQVAQAQRTNALGASVAATSAKRAGLPIIHISTDYVFDGEKSGAYREDDPVGPLSAYGRTKEKGEEGVRNGHDQHLILRTSWLYGIHGTNFLKTVVRLAAERDTLGFVAAQRGTPTWTADLAKAILVAAEAIAKGTAPWGTYHVAGAGATSRHGMATAIVAAQARFTHRTPPVEVIAVPENAARRPANSALDSSKFAETFGYAPGDWKEAIERTVNLLFAKQGKI
jgi:dTDP-4-dehydrorhamnose reductase